MYFAEAPLESMPTSVQAAYNIGQAANNAAQTADSLNSIIATSLQDGQLPTIPPPSPAYSASMTANPATNGYTVTLNPPPPGATQVTVQQSDSSGTSYLSTPVTVTNGTGGFVQPAPAIGAIAVTTVSGGGGFGLATTDIDSSYPSASDTTSFPTSATTISATYSGSWSWSGTASNGCPASDGGQFVAQITATDASFSGTITVGGLQVLSDNSCAVTSTDPSDTGSISGTVSGTTIQITSMVINGSVNPVTFTGSGTLTPTNLSASILHNGSSGQISADAQ
jgi:hypothetical protein